MPPSVTKVRILILISSSASASSTSTSTSASSSTYSSSSSSPRQRSTRSFPSTAIPCPSPLPLQASLLRPSRRRRRSPAWIPRSPLSNQLLKHLTWSAQSATLASGPLARPARVRRGITLARRSASGTLTRSAPGRSPRSATRTAGSAAAEGRARKAAPLASAPEWERLTPRRRRRRGRR